MINGTVKVGFKMLHEIIGCVTFTEACAEAMKQKKIEDSLLVVEQEGRVFKVSRSLLSPFPPVPPEVYEEKEQADIKQSLDDEGLL